MMQLCDTRDLCLCQSRALCVRNTHTTVAPLAWFALMGQANAEPSAEEEGVYSNSHLPFQKKKKKKTPTNIPVTACSCFLATSWVVLRKEAS